MRAALAEEGADVTAAAFGAPVRLDDVEAGGIQPGDQLARGPAICADDGVVEGFGSGAVEVAEQ